MKLIDFRTLAFDDLLPTYRVYISPSRISETVRKEEASIDADCKKKKITVTSHFQPPLFSFYIEARILKKEKACILLKSAETP